MHSRTDFDFARLRTAPHRAPRRGFTQREFQLRSARRGDLLIEKSGGGETQPVGRVVLHDEDELVVPTNFAGRIRPNNGVESSFLSYLLASMYFNGQTLAAVKQTTGIQNLDLDHLLSNRVWLPEVPEQQRIAAFLDVETERIEKLIATKSRMAERSVELRQSITYEAVAGSLGHENSAVKDSGIPWLHSVPSHWQEASLRLVAELGSGHTPSRSHPEWWIDCTVPWVTTGEVARLRSDRHEFIYETREKVSELGLANSIGSRTPRRDRGALSYIGVGRLLGDHGRGHGYLAGLRSLDLRPIASATVPVALPASHAPGPPGATRSGINPRHDLHA